MLRRARLIGGLALGWGLVHGLHAGALMLVPALLPLCGGSAAGGAGWLETVVPVIGVLGTLASFSTQAAALLTLPVVVATSCTAAGRVIVDALPKNHYGKVLKTALRQRGA